MNTSGFLSLASFSGTGSVLQLSLRPHQVVSGEDQQCLAGELRQALVACLAQPAHSLDPAEGLLDRLAPPEAQGIALAARGAAVDGATRLSDRWKELSG